jgi:hypothetical protein
MALNLPILQKSIFEALQSTLTAKDSVSAQQILATQLASAIDTYIKTASITVSTAGTATAQLGTGIIS